jgi:hypothetical protein
MLAGGKVEDWWTSMTLLIPRFSRDVTLQVQASDAWRVPMTAISTSVEITPVSFPQNKTIYNSSPSYIGL